jgi:hypothetical protein
LRRLSTRPEWRLIDSNTEPTGDRCGSGNAIVDMRSPPTTSATKNARSRNRDHQPPITHASGAANDTARTPIDCVNGVASPGRYGPWLSEP